jgi:predicted AlkP superfamily pyrophosphatase or phosphodiesterase
MTRVERGLLIVIDGLRPDALLQGHSPRIDALIAAGACSFQAQTVMPSVTLPTHMTLFHSVPTDIHGVVTNTYQPFPEPLPGLMQTVRQAGLRTAAVYSWEQLRDLWRPGQVDMAHFINIYSNPTRDFDMEVARLSAELIANERPEFTFIYLGMVDEVGHRAGWLSQEYMQSVTGADAAVGHVLDRLEAEGLLDTTIVLIQADHGGHEHRHGEAVPEDMTIPWILSGPGVRSSCQLAGQVSILDTAPTLVHVLGLPIPTEWQGQVIREALL